MKPRSSRTSAAGRTLLWSVLGLYFLLGTASRLPFLHHHAENGHPHGLFESRESGSLPESESHSPASGEDSSADSCLACHWLALAQSTFAPPNSDLPMTVPAGERIALPGDPKPFRWFAAPFPSRGPPLLLSA